jgi:ATP-dependent DNA helicase RecQ
MPPLCAPVLMDEPAETPEQVLRRVFGFPQFRGLQEDAVLHVVQGGDALVLMPTGAGKSICYQVPALCRAGTALVVSPLIALMDDQIAALRQLGIAAGALHSELVPEEAARVSGLLNAGALDLLYVSPERLLSAGTLDRRGALRFRLGA